MMRIGWLRAGVLLCLLPFVIGAGSAGASIRAASTPLIQDSGQNMNVNNLDMFMTNYGSFAYDTKTGDSGLIFPKGTVKTAVYAAGIWVGAKVEGNIRVSVAEYSYTYGPGKILPSGEPADPTLPGYKLYKIETGDTTSADYRNWPCADGAPCLPNGKPQLFGDQTIWAVYNDISSDRSSNNAATPEGLGLEIQQTTFGFNRTGALGNVIFVKFKIINPETGDELRDTYVSVWSDPDLGGAQDDLVGCDTTLSLGYCYNATNNDNLYGSAPPAVGFDFFQGPIVPGEPTDTALVDGRKIPGFKNLPMTSFNKYINGTDPDSPLASYNYMQGLEPDGAVLTDPTTGQPTTYYMPGDPVRNVGWLDSNPADRRMMLSSGPFNMAPGDTQTVVCALIVGAGQDRLTSITALKFYDLFAQAAFDANFDLPSPPPRPVVTTAQLDDELVLYWGDLSETAYNEPGYVFQGYNVYMGESVAGPWKRIFTYDLLDNIAIIFDDQFDLETGVVINKPVQFGADTGIRRRVRIDNDYIRGGTLRNGRPYFFGVTAYSYGADAEAGLKTLENSINPIELVPQVSTAGTRYLDGEAGDTLAVVRAGGASDGRVIPLLIDPIATTGETYEVTFAADSIGPYWDLKVSGSAARTVLEKQRNQTGDDTYAIAEGINWKVIGALPGFKRNNRPRPMVDEIAGPGGVAVEPDGRGGPGNDLFLSVGSTGEYILAVGGGDGQVSTAITRFTRNEANNTSSDILMKWDYAENNYGYWAFNDGEAGRVPFGLYEKNPSTGEEVRLVPLMNANWTPGVYDFSPDSVDVDAVFGFIITDWIYAYTIDPDVGTYEDFVQDAQDGVIDVDPTGEQGHELFARLVVGSEFIEDDPETPEDETRGPVLPQQGTVIQFSTTKPNTPDDVFRIATKGVRFASGDLKTDLKSIRVVPNPYFAHSEYEMNQFEHVVKFTRMPPYATVRIFNIAGDLVRTLEKTEAGTSILEWNLLTVRNLPVGSGVYLYHVEGKDAGGRVLGTATGRMAIFIEKERLNTF